MTTHVSRRGRIRAFTTDEVPAADTIPPLPEWVTPVCRLWSRSTTRGAFLAGKLGAAKVLIFRNPDKRDDDDADWVLTFAASGERGE